MDNLARELDRVLMELGNRLKTARHAMGLTQERVAFLADIDYKRYQRVEAGEVNVTLRTLVRIADALEADLWKDILGLIGDDDITEQSSPPKAPELHRADGTS